MSLRTTPGTRPVGSMPDCARPVGPDCPLPPAKNQVMTLFDIATALRSSGVAAARAVRRRLARQRPPVDELVDDFDEETGADPFRWQSVTILASPQDIAPAGRLPAPLAQLDDLIETRLRPAPGGRGTELSVRTRPGPRPDPATWKGEDPARRIHTALHHCRQLVEAGEVLRVHPQPAGRRRPARGLLVDLMSGDTDQEDVV